MRMNRLLAVPLVLLTVALIVIGTLQYRWLGRVAEAERQQMQRNLEFAIERLALGPLEARNLKGEYGALTPESYWAGGYIQDGLISHRFLRRYSYWTLDFDSRTYLFEK
mgnify:CR=1 FL=1